MLGAILPLTGWLPPSGPFRVYHSLSPAHGNPDETRTFPGDDAAQAYLRRQVERSDWQRWRESAPVSNGPFARRPWPWTIGDAIDASLILRDYPVDGEASVVLVEVPLLAIDRSEVILRAQTQSAHFADDHELCFVSQEDGSWTPKR